MTLSQKFGFHNFCSECKSSVCGPFPDRGGGQASHCSPRHTPVRGPERLRELRLVVVHEHRVGDYHDTGATEEGVQDGPPPGCGPLLPEAEAWVGAPAETKSQTGGVSSWVHQVTKVRHALPPLHALPVFLVAQISIQNFWRPRSCHPSAPKNVSRRRETSDSG